MSSPKLAITGANGQLGRAFKGLVPDAVFLDRTEMDLSSEAATLKAKVKEIKPDVFINCAAHTNVDQAEIESDIVDQINGHSVEAIAEACDEIGAKLVQISTDYVLNSDPGAKGHDEDEKPDPQSVYAKSKVLAENATLKYPGFMVVRTSGVFGEGKNFVKTMIELGRKLDELTIVDDQLMRPTYAHDLAETILKLIELDEWPPIVHVQNSGEPVTWADYAAKIFEIAGVKTNIRKISTAEYNKTTEAKRRADGNNIPVAPRPFNSVFSLKVLKQSGIDIRDWPAAVTDYIKTLS